MSIEHYDELDTLLDDLRTRDDETPQWEFCEGFMAALICCRRVIMPSEYLPVLLGMEAEEVTQDGAIPALFADEASSSVSWNSGCSAGMRWRWRSIPTLKPWTTNVLTGLR